MAGMLSLQEFSPSSLSVLNFFYVYRYFVSVVFPHSGLSFLFCLQSHLLSTASHVFLFCKSCCPTTDGRVRVTERKQWKMKRCLAIESHRIIHILSVLCLLSGRNIFSWNVFSLGELYQGLCGSKWWTENLF